MKSLFMVCARVKTFFAGCLFLFIFTVPVFMTFASDVEEYLVERGEEYLAQGYVEEACKSFEKALLMDPYNLEAKKGLHRAKEKLAVQKKTIEDFPQAQEDVVPKIKKSTKELIAFRAAGGNNATLRNESQGGGKKR